MPTLSDKEFGKVVIRTHHNARRITLRVAPDGRLRATVPPGTPNIAVSVLIKTSRSAVRELLSESQVSKRYVENQAIGKSHTLVIQDSKSTTSVKLVGTKILVNLNSNDNITQQKIQDLIKQNIIKALRKEAKSYLPRRLKFLAETHEFNYKNIRLTHASSRWGSCSSSGTISLNISLMQLPFELLDYVLIHELCHTRQMNHSDKFWSEIEAIDPNYKNHRKLLKKYSPNV